MDLRLDGKTALITAATAGIGLATAKQLANQGANLWINGRSEGRLEETRRVLEDQFPDVTVRAIAADVSTAAGCERVIDAVDDIDILIPMAGGTDNPQRYVDLSDDDWQYQFEYNVMQGVRLTRHYVPLLQTKNFGRIIFVTSEAGIVTPAELADYGVAKAAVIRLSRVVAELFAGSVDVTVNCVVPGPTKAPWVDRLVGDRDFKEVEAEVFGAQTTSLMRRFADAEHVAGLIGYLCSPAATATRGAVLRAEGGSIRTSV